MIRNGIAKGSAEHIPRRKTLIQFQALAHLSQTQAKDKKAQKYGEVKT
jgi:hypothetical protein